MNTRRVGSHGEDIAAAYLKKSGYKVLQRNFNCRFGEVDIIARDGDYIVFVEVKARADTSFGAPREAVDWHKQQRIIKCANAWLTIKKQYGAPVRFDVVEVLAGNVTLIRDAFRV